MIKNRFIKNTSWILVGQIIRMALSFVINVLTARYLGPENNGILNYVGSYISFFTSLIGLGLNGVIIYEFVNHRDEEGKILGTAILLRFFTSIISMAVFLGMIFVTDGGDKVIIYIALLQAIQMPFLCFDTVNYWCQSNMNSRYSVIAQTLAYVVMTIYKGYLLLSGKSVVWFAFALSLEVIVVAVMYFAVYNRYKVQNMAWSGSIAKRIFKSCLPFILADMMVVIYGHMDRIMIKWLMNSTREVGLYSAAITICTIISFLPTAILDSARPLIAEAKKESEEMYNLRFRQLVAGIMWIGFLYSIFITLLSKLVIYLMFGSQYMDANICLKIAVWYTAFSFVGSAKNFWFICEDKKKYVFIFSVLGAVCNVILNLFLIPVMGINGAALATLFTQMLVNFIIPLMFRQTRQFGLYVIDAMFLRKIQIGSLVKFVKAKFIK